jgi:hypothetical protein
VRVKAGLDSVTDPCQAALLVSYGTTSAQQAAKLCFQNFRYDMKKQC